MGKTEKEELIEAVLQYGLEELEYASKELLDDREVIAELVRAYDGDYQDVLEYASEDIQADSIFITRLAGMEKRTEEQSTIGDEEIDLPEGEWMNSAQELEYLKGDDEARRDKDYIKRLISQGVVEELEYAAEEVRRDPEVILESVRQDWSAIEYASEQLKSNKYFIQQLIELGTISDDQILEYASEGLKEDIEFFFELRDEGINLEGKNIVDISELRGDREFIFGLLRDGYTDALKWARESLLKDRTFFSDLSIDVPEIYEELSGEIILERCVKGDLDKDQEIVLDIMRYYGINQLKGASSELLGNKDFILELLDDEYLIEDQEDVSVVLGLVNRKLLEDKDFILSAIQLYGDSEIETAILQCVEDEVFKDKEFMLKLIDESGGLVLKYASEELKGDREFVLAAVNDDGTALEFASDELKGDKELVLDAVKDSGYALEFASEELKGDKEVVLEAVKNWGMVLEFASDELKGDKQIVMEALSHKIIGVKGRETLLKSYVSAELQDDSQIRRLVELANEIDGKREEMISKRYSYDQIAAAIEPTESMIKSVQAEMIEEMEKTTESEKDAQGQNLE